MKIVNRLLFFLHIFVGVGALVGGGAAIINPMQPLGMPIEPLKNSPFTNYLIPGIILFMILGVGNIYSAFMIHYKSKFQGYISSVFSCALVIWIVVQCLMLNAIAFLHVLFFSIGLIEVILSTINSFYQRLFPTNIILNFIDKKTVTK